MTAWLELGLKSVSVVFAGERKREFFFLVLVLVVVAS